MAESLKLLVAAERYRTLSTALSNPRDIKVVEQYVAELEERARLASTVGRRASKDGEPSAFLFGLSLQ